MNYLKTFENKLINQSVKIINRDFIKIHYTKIIELIGTIIFQEEDKDKNKVLRMKLNYNQYNLMRHLFQISSSIDYIPSM